MRAYAKQIYVCMRPSESADHLQPVADIPSTQNAAFRGSHYAGRKIAITIVFQSSSLRVVYNRINCLNSSLIEPLCVVTIHFLFITLEINFQIFVKKN